MHIGVHSRAYAFASSKKIFHNRHFTQHISISKGNIVLIFKGKGLYITQHGQLRFPGVGTFKKKEPETDNQHDEKADVYKNFLSHL